MPLAVELVDIDLALYRILARSFTFITVVTIGTVAVHKPPHSLLVKDIEIGALDAGVGHVRHVEVAHQVIAHCHAVAVGGKTDANSCRVLGSVPQGGAHAVLDSGGDAGVGREGVVPALVDHAKSQGVVELERVEAREVLCACGASGYCHEQCEKCFS